MRQQKTFRETLGVFDNMNDLQEAIRELEITAFPRDTFSVLSLGRDTQKIFGKATVAPGIAEDDMRAPRRAPARPEEKVIGTTAIIGAAGFFGAAFATLITLAISQERNETLLLVLYAALWAGIFAGIMGLIMFAINRHINREIRQQVRKGGLILWVTTPTRHRENLALEILQRHGAHHLKLHSRNRSRNDVSVGLLH